MKYLHDVIFLNTTEGNCLFIHHRIKKLLKLRMIHALDFAISKPNAKQR